MNTAGAARTRILDEYAPTQAVYDELCAPEGRIRPHWVGVIDGFEQEPSEELTRRSEHANRLIHDNGITYNAFSDAGKGVRPWQVDLLPLVLPASEWDALSVGLIQRAQLLSQILDDIYGPKELLASGALPPEVVYAHSGYRHQFCNLPLSCDRRLILVGCELARSPDGSWLAMADRTEAPAGAGYALENRIVISRTWPTLIHHSNVRRLAPFFRRLQQTLARLTPRATENPRIVVLTSGPLHKYYFEDVYLARYLGYSLVEGGDLAVRDDCVFIKTLDGLLRVDVILSRISEADIDPLELDSSATNGIAGLLQAIRKGNVAIANAPGCGFVESPVIMAFLPQLCRMLLNESLILPSVATWWCGEESSRHYVLSNLEQLVIKPAFQHSGSEEVFGERLTGDERSKLVDRILRSPLEFVAQERVARSSTPIWKDNAVAIAHAALRTFTVRHGDSYEAMPGALVRVSGSAGPMELAISAGDGSKDAWILSNGPVENISLLPTASDDAELRRNSPQLPSRVADNLFWLGRHLDRAEMSARLLRVIVDRLSGERDADEIPEMPALIRVLAAAGQIEPDYAIKGLDGLLPELEQRLPAALFDMTESHSLRSTVTEIARLASTVRDRLSHDTWRAFDRVDEQFLPPLQQAVIPLDEALTSLNQLVIDLAVCSGLINDGMVRGPAWRFLDIGRRIERAEFTSNLMREILMSDEAPPPSVLDAVLEVMDLKMTYRARYLANLRLLPVVDLLIADETNPRSLISQMVQLSQHLDQLPVDRKRVGLTEEKKTALAALHQLQILDLDDLLNEDTGGGPAALADFLKSHSDTVKRLAASISGKYLVHSGMPRSTQDEQ